MMKPLEGIKVVEIGTYVAVPSTARVLADWGADVIKIETLTGDAGRGNGRVLWVPGRPACNPIFAKDIARISCWPRPMCLCPVCATAV